MVVLLVFTADLSVIFQFMNKQIIREVYLPLTALMTTQVKNGIAETKRMIASFLKKEVDIGYGELKGTFIFTVS